jgi:hypothetical protein
VREREWKRETQRERERFREIGEEEKGKEFERY